MGIVTDSLRVQTPGVAVRVGESGADVGVFDAAGGGLGVGVGAGVSVGAGVGARVRAAVAVALGAGAGVGESMEASPLHAARDAERSARNPMHMTSRPGRLMGELYIRCDAPAK